MSAPEAGPSNARRWSLVLAIVLLMMSVPTFYHLESASRGWDAHALLGAIERIELTNGSYYVDGVDHKGPLWMVLYDIAERASSPDTLWFVIAGFIIILAAATAVILGWIVHRITGRFIVAVVGGIVVFAYLTLSSEEFSYVLYGRNLTSFLFAGSFAASLARPRRWSRNLAVAVSGALAGLAVQTIPTTGFAAIAVLTLVRSSAREAENRRTWVSDIAVWIGAAIAAFLSAPIYFLIRGTFDDFWSYWWTYNQHYAEAPGRSLVEQFSRAATHFWSYYADHVLFIIVPICFLVLTLFQRRSPLVWFRIALLLWWAAEMLSLVVAQRFYDHYFVAPFVPMSLMAILLVSSLMPERARPRFDLIVVVVGLVLVVTSGRHSWHDGVELLSRHGTDTRAVRESHLDTLPSERKFQRSLVGVFTSENEPIYAWHLYPGVYSELERPPATRYFENRWLTGFIHGAANDYSYVLPGTYDRFREDLAATPPVATLMFDSDPIPEELSFVRESSTAGFELIWEEDFDAFIEPTRFESLVENTEASELGLEGLPGWSTSVGVVEWDWNAGEALRPLVLNQEHTCYGLRARINLRQISSALGAFAMGPIALDSEYAAITLGPGYVSSERLYPPSAGFEVYERVEHPELGIEGSRMLLLVRREHAVLFLNDRLVAAISSPIADPALVLRPPEGKLTLRGLELMTWPKEVDC